MLHDTTLTSIATDIAKLSRKIDNFKASKTTSPYQMQELLNRDKTTRNGILTKHKFIRMCQMLRHLNNDLKNAPGYLVFAIPENAEEIVENDEDKAFRYFTLFYNTSLRQPKPFRPQTILGFSPPPNPDNFVDYLLMLLDKNKTVSTYIPKALEAVSLQHVKQQELETLLERFMRAFVVFVLHLRPNLPNLSNVSTICARPLVQHLLLPMIRHALLAPRFKNENISFVGIQDLPSKITLHLKEGVQKAWNNLFTGIDYHDYQMVSDGPKLKVLETIMKSLDNQPLLHSTISSLYSNIAAIPGMGSKNASVLVLMLYAVTHYLISCLFLYLLTSGDRIITGSDLDVVVDNDFGLQSLFERTPTNTIIKPEDDPDLFFSQAQKTYMRVAAVHWEQVKKSWPLMHLEQKKRIREAVQKKINERLAFDRLLMDDDRALKKPSTKTIAKEQKLNNYDFFQL